MFVSASLPNRSHRALLLQHVALAEERRPRNPVHRIDFLLELHHRIQSISQVGAKQYSSLSKSCKFHQDRCIDLRVNLFPPCDKACLHCHAIRTRRRTCRLTSAPVPGSISCSQCAYQHTHICRNLALEHQAQYRSGVGCLWYGQTVIRVTPQW